MDPVPTTVRGRCRGIGIPEVSRLLETDRNIMKWQLKCYAPVSHLSGEAGVSRELLPETSKVRLQTLISRFNLPD